MNTVVVLVGVAGAGKSTLIARARQIHGVRILQPSTTRPLRKGETNEYDWRELKAWNNSDYAWTIEAKGHRYGMRKSELHTLKPGEIGLTVFHPGSLEALDRYSPGSDLEFVTVGLDTVKTHDQLKTRLGDDNSRDEGLGAFTSQRKIVCECDAVLRGDADTVSNAIGAIFRAVVARGVLDKESIGNLIQAGTLLHDTTSDNIQTASYDLRVGDTIWCKGKTQQLQLNTAFPIPPYSYVLVEAREQADLPKFILAHYDLKVSLFMHGVILSNGPQVDPGYRGGLLCMLFNGSDVNVGLRRGEHFATIEFLVTNRVTKGYKGKHQSQQTLVNFMPSTTEVGPGGTILDRLGIMEGAWERFRNVFIVAGIALVLTLIVGIGSLLFWGINTWSKADSAVQQVEEQMNAVDSLLYEVREMNERVEAGLSHLRTKQALPSGLSVPDSISEAIPAPSQNIAPHKTVTSSANSDSNESTKTLESKP